MQFHLYITIFLKVISEETEHFEFNLCIPLTYPSDSIKFELNVCNCCRDNVRKDNEDGMMKHCNTNLPPGHFMAEG